jgi:hypothetical protein
MYRQFPALFSIPLCCLLPRPEPDVAMLLERQLKIAKIEIT